MWVILAFFSALCLGGYDISKKIALRGNRVVDVLTYSIVISSLILSVPLVLSRVCPEWMTGTAFYVPRMDMQAHLLTLLKSCIVLSSWVFAFVSLKHLPLSVVSPMQATSPMWTLIGALFIFGERLNAWQWAGISLAIGSIFIFSLRKQRRQRKQSSIQRSEKSNLQIFHTAKQIVRAERDKQSSNLYYIALVLAILIGSCSGLYDKFMMRRYDHNAVQVYYNFYQAIMMLVVWTVDRFAHRTKTDARLQQGQRHLSADLRPSTGWLPIVLISVFLIISDNVYMLALRDPDSLIAVVSTIRRGGAVLSFAYGLVFLHETDPRKKIACMAGIMAGLICLAVGSL